MSWWGKIAGGTFGFMLGGPLGAMFGAALGHQFDKGLSVDHDAAGSAQNEQIQAAFFTATFSVMGHVAKADGRVSEEEIRIANQLMSQMALNEQQTAAAQHLFQQGKDSDFDLDGTLKQFRQICGRRSTLLIMFMEIQFHAAFADGEFHENEQELLRSINHKLGFGDSEYRAFKASVQAQGYFHRDDADHALSPEVILANAYEMLSVSPNDSDAEIKKAYRRMMSQHHPDKLVAKGLPEEMMKLATEKTQEIKAAYEVIQAHRRQPN